MSRRTLRFATGITVIVTAALSACGGDTEPTPGEEGTPVAITVTRTGCQVATAELSAGSITFTITNQSGTTAEVGVYATGGRPLAAQRGIGAGAVTDLVAALDPGSYEVACRTGEGGRESRHRITVR